MKQEQYSVGDKVKFERKDASTVTICHVKKVCVHEKYYLVDWLTVGGFMHTTDDKFSFDAVSEIQQGKNEYWKITVITRTLHLPEELFTI